MTCVECRFNDYCDSDYRAKNGVGCKRKCDCCSLYVRRTLDLDKPLGFNDDGTEVTLDVADEAEDVESTYFKTEQQDAIAVVIASLDPVDRELWHCLVRKTKKNEIAKKLNMTLTVCIIGRKSWSVCSGKILIK